jgi:hypothetical protein
VLLLTAAFVAAFFTSAAPVSPASDTTAHN